jgi:hypothetical protein
VLVGGRPPAGRVRSPGPRLAPPARVAQELKGPANAAPFCSTHGSRFAPTHPLHFSVAPRRLGGAVGSFAAAPAQTQEKEYEDRVEEWRWRTEMGKLGFACLFACNCLSAPALALYLF